MYVEERVIYRKNPIHEARSAKAPSHAKPIIDDDLTEEICNNRLDYSLKIVLILVVRYGYDIEIQ